MWGPSLFAPNPDEAPQPFAFAPACAGFASAEAAPGSDPMTDDEQDAAAAPPLAAVVNPVRRDDHVALPATPQPPSSTSLWGSFRGPVASHSLEGAAGGHWPAQSWQPNSQQCYVSTAVPDANSTSQLGASQRRTPNAPIKTRNVYVGALPVTFTERDLASMLNEFGKLKSCRMFNTGTRVAEIGRAYGFALFEDATSAERAVEALNGKPLGTARIQCRLSRNGVLKKPKKQFREAATLKTPSPPAQGPLATHPPAAPSFLSSGVPSQPPQSAAPFGSAAPYPIPVCAVVPPFAANAIPQAPFGFPFHAAAPFGAAPFPPLPVAGPAGFVPQPAPPMVLPPFPVPLAPQP